MIDNILKDLKNAETEKELLYKSLSKNYITGETRDNIFIKIDEIEEIINKLEFKLKVERELRKNAKNNDTNSTEN